MVASRTFPWFTIKRYIPHLYMKALPFAAHLVFLFIYFLANIDQYSSAEILPPMTSTNSEPAIARKGTWASVATALARRVFPQPGGPSSREPLGTLAPSWRYRSGFCQERS